MLRIGTASYHEMKAWTMAVVRGGLRPNADDPKVWFTSVESAERVLSAGNGELLQVIMEQRSSISCDFEDDGF